MIDRFCAQFDRLRKNFDSGIGLDTALVLSRTAPIIDAMSECPFISSFHQFANDCKYRTGSSIGKTQGCRHGRI